MSLLNEIWKSEEYEKYLDIDNIEKIKANMFFTVQKLNIDKQKWKGKILVENILDNIDWPDWGGFIIWKEWPIEIMRHKRKEEKEEKVEKKDWNIYKRREIKDSPLD